MSSAQSQEQPGMCHGTSKPRLDIRPKVQHYRAAGPALQQIQFLHPAYPDTENLLLILPAFDSGGIHHGTARIACAILANCHWDGYLSTSRHGPRITLGMDEILMNPTYYFRIDEDTDYAVTPSFEHFVFPPTLPDYWQNAPINPTTTDRVHERDQTCRISCSTLPNEVAHVIPVTQEEWWRQNMMYMRTLRPDSSLDTNCADNAILLRRDLHFLWDSHKFAIVPKEEKWVVHILNSQATTELQERYHNIETQPIIGVPAEFLFARFALAIFAGKGIFTKQGSSRKLNLKLSDGRLQPKVLSDKGCRLQFGSRSKSRSQSATKRQRAAGGEDNNDWEQEILGSGSWKLSKKRRRESSSSSFDERSSGDEYIDDSSSEEEEDRGRPRQRHYCASDFGEKSTVSSVSVPGTCINGATIDAASVEYSRKGSNAAVTTITEKSCSKADVTDA